jgi:hypothetical protein
MTLLVSLCNKNNRTDLIPFAVLGGLGLDFFILYLLI